MNQQQGKPLTSLNAVKHGLCTTAMIPGENPNDFNSLHASLLKHYLPVGELEKILVTRIANLVWRLFRCEKTETSMIWLKILGDREQDALKEIASITRLVDPFEMPYDKPYEQVLDQGKYDIATKKIERLKRMQKEPQIITGKTFAAAQESFLNLSRYETGIERNLFRTSRELERVQSIRKGQLDQFAQNAPIEA